MTRTPRRFLLRDRTAQAHADLDAMVGEWKDARGYRDYVAGLAEFRLPVEAMLRHVQWPAGFGEWRPLMIADALRIDMHAVDARQPKSGEVPGPGSESSLVGLCYVLEGSALGARVLVNRARDLGFAADNGASHLAILANSVENWRTFLTLLEASTAFDIDEAAAGALNIFDRAQSAFRARQDAEP